MAGAMRLGELAHLMESRLKDGDRPAHASPQLFDALDEDLDHIAFVLDGLRGGEVQRAAAGFAARTEAAGEAADAGGSARPAGRRPPVAGTAGRRAARAARDAAGDAAPPAPPRRATEAIPEMESGARAQLRVRADIIDRLVNEAGEVADRARRASKASCAR